MSIKSMLPDVWRGAGISNPIRGMSRLQRRMDRLFDELLSEPTAGIFNAARSPWMSQVEEFTPACDVEETKSHFLMNFDLPGVKKDEVKIELQDNTLTVSGERKREHKEEEQGRLTQERYYGAFTRSFALPSNVSADKVEANFDNGVLQIALPKVAITTGKQIPVKEGKLLESKSGKAA